MNLRTLFSAALFAVSLPLAAQQLAPELSPADRLLAKDIFAELINTNTSHSVGSTTVAAEEIAARLRKAGFAASDVQILGPDAVDGKRKNLLVTWRGKAAAGATAQKPVMFMCHLDVVEAPRDQWQTDPFAFTEKDGYYYGRGTQDIKDCDAALVTDMTMLRRDGFVPARDLYFAFTADEEGGNNNGVDWLFRNRPELRQLAFVINPDAGQFAARDGHPYALLYEATEKTYADFALKITGPGGHSSLPTADNILDDLAAGLARIQAEPWPVELSGVTRTFFTGMATMAPADQAQAIQGLLATPPNPHAVAAISQERTLNAMLHTTCVPTMIHGGEATNALPAAAEANINCRILPGHSREEVHQQLRERVSDMRIAIQYKPDGDGTGPNSINYQGFLPPPDDPAVFVPLAAALHQQWPAMPMVPELAPGASDCIYPAAAGVPCYGISGFPQDLDDIRYHARDERIRVVSYYAGVEFYLLFIQQLGR